MTDTGIRNWVEEYLTFRRGLGFSLEGPAWSLRAFARYAEQVGHDGPLTLDLATGWALASRSSDPVHAARRLAVIRPFAQHRAVIDPAPQVPPAGVFGRRAQRPPPHIYSESEIAALLQAASRGHPHGGLGPKTYVTFFGLLASTGLRLAEGCRLACHDVDLVRGVLTITNTKFRKSRLVPLHPSATAALTRYAAVRGDAGGAFFRTDRVLRLTPAAVKKTFARLRERLGWTTAGRARRPRVHDLRHTFAVRCRLRWYADGADVGQKLLALSTYLGHAKVTDTYWYLTAVPELLALAAQRFASLAQPPERAP